MIQRIRARNPANNRDNANRNHPARVSQVPSSFNAFEPQFQSDDGLSSPLESSSQLRATLKSSEFSQIGLGENRDKMRSIATADRPVRKQHTSSNFNSNGNSSLLSDANNKKKRQTFIVAKNMEMYDGNVSSSLAFC